MVVASSLPEMSRRDSCDMCDSGDEGEAYARYGGDAADAELVRRLEEMGVPTSSALYAALIGRGADRHVDAAPAADPTAAGRVLQIGDPVRCRDRADTGAGTDWYRGVVTQTTGQLKVKVHRGAESYRWDVVEYIGGSPLRQGSEPWVEGQGWVEDISSDDDGLTTSGTDSGRSRSSQQQSWTDGGRSRGTQQQPAAPVGAAGGMPPTPDRRPTEFLPQSGLARWGSAVGAAEGMFTCAACRYPRSVDAFIERQLRKGALRKCKVCQETDQRKKILKRERNAEKMLQRERKAALAQQAQDADGAVASSPNPPSPVPPPFTSTE